MDQVESTLNSKLGCFTETVPKQAINIEKNNKKTMIPRFRLTNQRNY